jgi:divinyl protochlorophyllide a 8-vinyl-reductase
MASPQPESGSRINGKTGRIGPNAVIRLQEALCDIAGREASAAIFRRAALEKYLASPPLAMVDEAEVVALHRALHAAFDDERARKVSQIAGRKTAAYLLGHRIPQVAQRVMRSLPSMVACRLLAHAIARNAWTFVGSGHFAVHLGRPTVFTIGECPICRGMTAPRPTCDFYAATFERLFAELVDPHARVEEVECLATGGAACRFSIVW